MAQGRIAPGPRVLPLVGNTVQFARDPLGFYSEMARTHGDVVKVGLAGKTCFLLNHPDHVAHVLQANVHRYVKSATYQELARLLGNGMLTAEGSIWRRHRRIAQPAFHRRSLDRLTDMLFDSAESCADRLRLRRGQVLNMTRECERVALDIIGRALFGRSLGDKTREIEVNLDAAVRYLNSRAEAPLPLPWGIPTAARQLFLRNRARLDAVVYELIEERRAHPEVTGDLLSMLMHAEVEDDSFTDEDLRDEVLTLMGAGYETTATTLGWTLVALSRFPTLRARVEAEIDAAWMGDDPHHDVLDRTDLVTRMVKETLRLYPPGWSLTRVATEDDVIGGYAIPKGSVVIVSPYLAHHDPRFWDNPEGYDPDRFTEEATKLRPRFCYLPFGAGQRMCIGERLAMLEMKIVLSRLLREFRFDLVPGTTPIVSPGFVLRPDRPLQMSVRQR